MSGEHELEKFRKQWRRELSKTTFQEATGRDSVSVKNSVAENENTPKLAKDGPYSPSRGASGKNILKEETIKLSEPSTSEHPAFRDDMSYTCKILSNNPTSDKNSSYYPFAIVGNLLNSTNESPGNLATKPKQIYSNELQDTARSFQLSTSTGIKPNKKLKLERIFAPTKFDSKTVQQEHFLEKFIEDLVRNKHN